MGEGELLGNYNIYGTAFLQSNLTDLSLLNFSTFVAGNLNF